MKNLLKEGFFFIAIILIVAYALKVVNINKGDEINQIPFSEVYTNLESSNIKTINFEEQKIYGELKNGQKFESYLPNFLNNSNFTDEVLEKSKKDGLTVNAFPESKTGSWVMNFLPSIILIVILTGVLLMSLQRQGGVRGPQSPFGSSAFNPKHMPKDDSKNQKIKFKDVAGLDEEKEELKEVVDFLKNPSKYKELGARIPKGMLLVGPPGTGKTYLSKAVAGEAGVPFLSISGSGFVEMFVGVGASRVRELFDQAKKNSPCIVFIDEIDAVGRRRGAGLGGGHDEREQTLNQLLVEMDGFSDNEGVIVMAATNRPDILDPALLRPGRFDRQVMVGVPDIKAREEILKVHARNKPLEDDVEMKTLAKRTPGFTPADIENLMNEAAILTARENKSKISMAVIEEAITKVIAGIPKKSRIITEYERKIVSYHEAGHAVVATLLPDFDPVHQVTIIPRGMAGGFTMTLPESDVNYVTKTKMKDEIVDLLAGRIAEKLVLDDITTGASNDLQRVSQIARDMVTKYGFSEKFKAITFGSGSNEVFIGRDFASKKNYSEEIASLIDEEVDNIVNEAYDRCEKLLTDNIDKLHSVAKALMEYETLNKDDFKKAYNGELKLNKDKDNDKSSNDNDKCNNEDSEKNTEVKENLESNEKIKSELENSNDENSEIKEENSEEIEEETEKILLGDEAQEEDDEEEDDDEE